MRKCRLSTCRSELPPTKKSDFWQKKGFCSCDHMTEHGLAKARATLERQRKAKHREDKERIKTRSEWMKEAQSAFNAFVRERDKALPCVSCGRFHNGQNHAGHYRSVGSEPALRFNEDNVWLQCAPCNNHLSGNLIKYRVELLKRVGQEKIDWIEGPHDPKRYTVDDLKGLIKEYRGKLKELRRDGNE